MAYVAMTREEETENLRETIAMLNDTSERLDDWKGKNWSHDDAVWLRRMVLIRRREGKFRPEDRARLEKFTEKIRVSFDGNLIDYYTGDTAAMNFVRLIRNSREALLREPCLKCEEWYISKTHGKTDFCSRPCAGSAMQARKRKRESDRKLKKAEAAIKNYPARPTRFAEMDWKQYVSKATGISKKFLTVAVRNGELLPPKVSV